MILTPAKKLIFVLVVVSLGFVIWRHWFHEEIINRHPSGSKIIAFGDSLTAGFGADSGQDYPTVLSQLAGITVENRGVNGETTEDALQRLERDVLTQDPRIVIVMLGGNDMMQRVSPDTTFNNLRKMIRSIQDKGAMVILVGVEGPLFTGDYGKRYKALAKETGCAYVDDILSGILTDPALKSDQVHPNAKGYRLVAERIHKKLKRFL